MATLKSSALVKVLIPAVLLVAAGIGLYAGMSGSLDKMAPLTPEQWREPGIAGGTPQDTQAISAP
ncbi:TIGR03752 family integrating conjugative element protein, partial [Salmonella enterica]|nr:TIGR03752 family integrating conjugative element protein [Salmonella enterica]